jgi:hypothetical protein
MRKSVGESGFGFMNLGLRLSEEFSWTYSFCLEIRREITMK